MVKKETYEKILKLLDEEIISDSKTQLNDTYYAKLMLEKQGELKNFLLSNNQECAILYLGHEAFLTEKMCKDFDLNEPFEKMISTGELIRATNQIIEIFIEYNKLHGNFNEYNSYNTKLFVFNEQTNMRYMFNSAIIKTLLDPNTLALIEKEKTIINNAKHRIEQENFAQEFMMRNNLAINNLISRYNEEQRFTIGISKRVETKSDLINKLSKTFYPLICNKNMIHHFLKNLSNTTTDKYLLKTSKAILHDLANNKKKYCSFIELNLRDIQTDKDLSDALNKIRNNVNIIFSLEMDDLYSLKRRMDVFISNSSDNNPGLENDIDRLITEIIKLSITKYLG